MSRCWRPRREVDNGEVHTSQHRADPTNVQPRPVESGKLGYNFFFWINLGYNFDLAIMSLLKL
jgi:hypothetical protein